VLAKLREEIDELERARIGRPRHIVHEMGDVIFLRERVRFLKIDADEALQLSTSKFIRRFRPWKRIPPTVNGSRR
jgi:uncharacterized protein YabN with tetrapyrrole methylase and pyrophosphatase domain